MKKNNIITSIILLLLIALASCLFIIVTINGSIWESIKFGDSILKIVGVVISYMVLMGVFVYSIVALLFGIGFAVFIGINGDINSISSLNEKTKKAKEEVSEESNIMYAFMYIPIVIMYFILYIILLAHGNR